MKSPNLGQMVAEAWDSCMEDEEYRKTHLITELHRWERARNGRWVDRGYLRCPARRSIFVGWFDGGLDYDITTTTV